MAAVNLTDQNRPNITPEREIRGTKEEVGNMIGYHQIKVQQVFMGALL
jgi:hypothetical protein